MGNMTKTKKPYHLNCFSKYLKKNLYLYILLLLLFLNSKYEEEDIPPPEEAANPPRC
jgi:hypothetical protein